MSPPLHLVSQATTAEAWSRHEIAMRSTPLVMILPSLVLAMFIIGYPISIWRGRRYRKSAASASCAASPGSTISPKYSVTSCSGTRSGRTVMDRGRVGGTLHHLAAVALILNDDFIGAASRA